MHPKEAKLQLGAIIVDMFHPQGEGLKARQYFESTFSQHQIPQDIVEFKFDQGQKLLDILMLQKIVASKNEGRRLLKEGAISHEGKGVSDEEWALQKGVLKIGKRRFLRLS